MLGPILSVGGDALKFVKNHILQCMWRAPYNKDWVSSVLSRHDLTLCKIFLFLSFTYLLVFFFPPPPIVKLLKRKFHLVLKVQEGPWMGV